MTRLRYALTLAALALPLGLTGCDALTGGTDAPPVESASPKLRHWDLLTRDLGNGQAAVLGDSIDFIVTFSDLVADPETAADQLFMAQEVVRRTYYRDSFTGVAVTASADELNDILNGLIASDSVAYVEPDVPLEPVTDLPNYVALADLRTSGAYGNGEWRGEQLRPWSVKRVEGDKSWAKSGDGQGTVDVDVYVIDGPIAHPDLNVVERVSFLPAGLTAAGTLHGTHVAGVIGARDDAAGLVGIAPGARIHSLEVLDARGATTMSTLLSAVEFVTARRQAEPARPMVVNMSIGMDVGTTRMNALDEAVTQAVAAGVTFVVSAGNGAADAATYSPAHAPGVIAVGATDNYDSFAGTFSNRGANVTLLAPGVDVLSLADGGRYASLSGTSMAAPHVAGGVALYLARNPSASPAAVRAALLRESKQVSHHGHPAGTTRNRLRVKDL